MLPTSGRGAGRCRQGQDFPGKRQEATEGGAKSGAVSADCSPTDPDLAHILDAWPTLPQAVRAGILALVRAAAAEL